MKKEKITTARPDIYELEPITEEGCSCSYFLLGVVVALLTFISYLVFMNV